MTKQYYKYEETHRTVKGRKQKYCTQCRKWKGENEFGRDRAKRDGLKIRCKTCDTAYARDLRWRKKNVREYLRFEQRHRIVKGVKQKLCGGCGQWKDESDFYRHRWAKDGLAGWCRECEISRARKRCGRKNRGARKNLRYDERHRVVNGIREKLCTKCRKWKRESEYYTDRARKDGLSFRCQKCSHTTATKSRK